MRPASTNLFKLALIMLACTLTASAVGLWTSRPVPVRQSVVPTAHARTIRLTLDIDGEQPELLAGHVVVVVNGKPVAAFRSTEILLTVRNADLIEIDSALEATVRVKVKEISPGIVTPRTGDSVSVKHSVETLGNVIYAK